MKNRCQTKVETKVRQVDLEVCYLPPVGTHLLLQSIALLGEVVNVAKFGKLLLELFYSIAGEFALGLTNI